MRSLFTARNVTVALSATLLAGLALGGAAHALTEAVYRYTTPQTGYLTVPPAAFVPTYNTDGFTNSGVALLATADNTCFAAPVNLPHGAKVTQLTVWNTKNSMIETTADLGRWSLSDQDLDLLATVHTTNTGGQLHVFSANVPASKQVVNNMRFTYVIFKCLVTQEYFYGARIKYTYTKAGD